MNISVKPLMPDLLEDYLSFFDNLVFTENPDWSGCYCYSFHFVGPDEQWNKEDNRSSVIKLINEKEMAGYLAYSDNKPVGWCNANDRLKYQRLLKYYDLMDNPHDKVCSIVCFVVQSDYRRKGIAESFWNRSLVIIQNGIMIISRHIPEKACYPVKVFIKALWNCMKNMALE